MHEIDDEVFQSVAPHIDALLKSMDLEAIRLGVHRDTIWKAVWQEWGEERLGDRKFLPRPCPPE